MLKRPYSRSTRLTPSSLATRSVRPTSKVNDACQVVLLGVATFVISLWALIESVRSIHGAASHFWAVVAQAQTQVRHSATASGAVFIDTPALAGSAETFRPPHSRCLSAPAMLTWLRRSLAACKTWRCCIGRRLLCLHTQPALQNAGKCCTMVRQKDSHTVPWAAGGGHQSDAGRHSDGPRRRVRRLHDPLVARPLRCARPRAVTLTCSAIDYTTDGLNVSSEVPQHVVG